MVKEVIFVNKKGDTGIIVLVVLVLLLLIGVMWYIGGLNRAVRLDEGVNSAWAQVENVLQRRNDLIPNLINRNINTMAAITIPIWSGDGFLTPTLANTSSTMTKAITPVLPMNISQVAIFRRLG